MAVPQPEHYRELLRRVVRVDAPSMGDADLQQLIERLDVRNLEPREVLLRSEQHPRLSYIVVDGWLREYLLLEDGAERNVRFILRGEQSGTQLSNTFVQAGVSTTMLFMTYRDYRALCSEHSAWESYNGCLTKRLLRESVQREHELLTLDAKGRYQALIARRPEIEILPQREIASYLGISAVHLSRLRSSLSKGGDS